MSDDKAITAKRINAFIKKLAERMKVDDQKPDYAGQFVVARGMVYVQGQEPVPIEQSRLLDNAEEE